MIAPQQVRAAYPQPVWDRAVVLLTGQSGQGATLAGDLLVEAATAEGWQADIAEQHELRNSSMPGGVSCTVCIAQESPASGEWSQLPVDWLLALETEGPLQALDRLAPTGLVLANRSLENLGSGQRLIPYDSRIHLVGHEIPGGRERPLLVAMFFLGLATRQLPIELKTWEQTFQSHLPSRLRSDCWRSFELGKSYVLPTRAPVMMVPEAVATSVQG